MSGFLAGIKKGLTQPSSSQGTFADTSNKLDALHEQQAQNNYERREREYE